VRVLEKWLFLSAMLFVSALPALSANTGAGAGEMWPLELEYGACVRNNKQPDVLVWTPPKARRLRALLIIIANTDSKHFGEHGTLRKVAAKREMGVVYLRCGEVIDDLSRRRPGKNDTIIQGILDAVAKETGIAEFRHAPWIPFGKSSMGRFPFWMAWAYPERTIAGISYHGETPTWPPAPWANLDGESVLYASVNGETEWGGTWNRHVRPSLLNYRAQQNWLPHQVIVYDVGHGNYPDTHGSPGWGKSFPDRVTCIDVWDYLALFVDKAIEARVPNGSYPTRGPVKLNQLEESTGWLIDPFAIERLFEIPPQPLKSSPTGYVVDPAGDEPTPGFVVVSPAAGFRPPTGVPVVPLDVGRSPSEWLVTEGTDFAMKDDPMRSLGAMQSLRPKPGDKVKIDGVTATFQPIDSKHVRREGGINLRGGLQRGEKSTLMAYTVIEVPRRRQLKLKAPFTQNGRVQVVLGGEPIAHGQIVEVDKGLYPMLVVVRLRTKWQSLHVSFEEAPADEVAQARKLAAELARKKVESEETADTQAGDPIPLIQKVAEVDETDRNHRFWIIDRDLAEAWLRLHDVKGIAK
jgi:hypothetical protein